MSLVERLANFTGGRRRSRKGGRSTRRQRGGKCSTLHPASVHQDGGRSRRRGGRRSARRQRGGYSALPLTPSVFGSSDNNMQLPGAFNESPQARVLTAGGSRRRGHKSRRSGHKSRRGGRFNRRTGRNGDKNRGGRKSRRGGLSSQLVPLGLIATLLGTGSKKRKSRSR